MFERKLISLQYDCPSINVEDEAEYKDLIYWLECMKIRFYPPDSRGCIKSDSKTWNESFNKYLDEINYQGPRDDRKIILDWILNLALRYEMEDTRVQMNMSKTEIADLVNLDKAENIANIDINSPEFLKELEELSKMLNIPFYDKEPLVTLRAIAILLCKLRKSARNMEQSSNDTQTQPNQSKKIKIVNTVDEKILNVPIGKSRNYDPILNRCANVLRLLYINDLRELQTNINNVIVHIQSETANPKTDTTLGKVGR